MFYQLHRFSLGHKLCRVAAVVLNNVLDTTATTQRNLWLNENRDVEMGVCVLDRGFRRNLTPLKLADMIKS